MPNSKVISSFYFDEWFLSPFKEYLTQNSKDYVSRRYVLRFTSHICGKCLETIFISLSRSCGSELNLWSRSTQIWRKATIRDFNSRLTHNCPNFLIILVRGLKLIFHNIPLTELQITFVVLEEATIPSNHPKFYADVVRRRIEWGNQCKRWKWRTCSLAVRVCSSSKINSYEFFTKLPWSNNTTIYDVRNRLTKQYNPNYCFSEWTTIM